MTIPSDTKARPPMNVVLTGYEPRRDPEPLLFGAKLNTAQAAQLCGVTVGTMRQWRSKKIGPSYYKVRGSVWYLRSELLSFVAACRFDCR